ncbi:MAG: hypothetical protein IIA87_01230 [Nanoarchaeota archaeon]|nr:hypothetical protein [Nanoarchaeota archaeon]
MNSEVNHEGEIMETESNPRDVVVDDSENRRQRRMRGILKDIATFATLGAVGYWMVNAAVYMSFASFYGDKYEKMREPLDSSARDMNQYSQIEQHLSEDGLAELARRRTAYNELDEEIGPSVRAAWEKFDHHRKVMVGTHLGVYALKKLGEHLDKVPEATENELSQENGDREE